MFTARKFVLSFLALAPVALAADPSLLDFVMPDAKVAFGVDIARLRTSPLSQSLGSGIHDANPDMQKLMEAAGFDPLRDLDEILVASSGSGTNAPVLLVARGRFDTPRLLAFAQSAGSKAMDVDGIQILTDPDKKSGGFALVDNSLILGGSLDEIRRAIARRGRGTILNADIATRIDAMSRRYDAWLISVAPLASVAANVSDPGVKGMAQSEALKSIEQFSLGFGLSSDFSIAAEITTRTEKDAASLADGLRMLIGMVTKKVGQQPEAMKALKSLNFGVEGRSVRLGLTVPQAEVEKAIQASLAMKEKSRAAVKSPRPAPAAPGSPAPKAAPPPSNPRVPQNADLVIYSSPKDMGTVVIKK